MPRKQQQPTGQRGSSSINNKLFEEYGQAFTNSELLKVYKMADHCLKRTKFELYSKKNAHECFLMQNARH